MKINNAFREELSNSVLCWLATLGADGMPNVTPKEIFAIHDDETLVIADIMSANSVRNILGHRQVCVSFIDVFRQKGFKVEGVASILAPDSPDFAVFSEELRRMAGADNPIRHVIRVRIERISRILAPSYRLFPERSDQERMDGVFLRYGVRPIHDA